MESPGFGPSSSSQAQRQQARSQNIDIDKGTEMWRETLATRSSSVYQPNKPRAVEGGLPPHLLFKKSETDHVPEASNYELHGTKEVLKEENVPPQPLLRQSTNVFSVAEGPVATPPQHQNNPPQDAWQGPRYPRDAATHDFRSHNQPSTQGIARDVRNSQSHMHSEAKEKGGFHLQLQGVCRPIDSATPTPGDSSGIKQKFKAKKSRDRESQSLPHSVSSVKSQDGGYEAGDDSVQVKSIAAESGSHTSPGDRSGNGRESRSREYAHIGAGDRECRQWLDDLPQPPRCYFLEMQIERHFECDVEPTNGSLIPPIEYPETHINPLDKPSKQEAVRRLNGTAGLKAFADLERSRRRAQVTEATVCNEQQLRLKAGPRVSNGQSSGQTQQPKGLPRQAQATADIVPSAQNDPGRLGQAENVQSNTIPEDSIVSKSFFLRPAQEDDLAQLLAIYNWEVTNGVQALDNEPLVFQDMQRIFSHCRAGETPFIVAVAGTPAEAAVRKEIPAPVQSRPYKVHQTGPYSQLLHYHTQAHGHQRTASGLDKLLGFAFVSIPKPGLAGNVKRSVHRFQGRVHVYVDPQHRRKGIGRALLHKLARCCSIYSVDMGNYEWFDPSESRVCDRPGFNPRNYAHLIVETASRSEDDPATAWYAKFLDSEGFLCVAASEKTRRIGNEENGQWLDNLIWQLDCQDVKSIRENGQNTYNL